MKNYSNLLQSALKNTLSREFNVLLDVGELVAIHCNNDPVTWDFIKAYQSLNVISDNLESYFGSDRASNWLCMRTFEIALDVLSSLNAEALVDEIGKLINMDGIINDSNSNVLNVIADIRVIQLGANYIKTGSQFEVKEEMLTINNKELLKQFHEGLITEEQMKLMR